MVRELQPAPADLQLAGRARGVRVGRGVRAAWRGSGAVLLPCAEPAVLGPTTDGTGTLDRHL